MALAVKVLLGTYCPNIYTVGPGFAETIYGRKRWFLTAPDVKIQEYFHPNKTTLQWYVVLRHKALV